MPDQCHRGPLPRSNSFFQVASELCSSVAAQSQEPCLKKILSASGASMDLLGKGTTFLMGKFQEGLNNKLGKIPHSLRDSEFDNLTDWCVHNNEREYAKRPRTFAVLYWARCPEAIDGFVSGNFTDIYLPYTERNLPSCVKGQQMRSKFLEIQKYVLTNYEEAIQLETPGNNHLNIHNSAARFFDIQKPLGSGGFGEVYQVISRRSLKTFAVKRISRGQSFQKDRLAIQSFENELKALKKLSHKHLVKLIGSYTDELHVGLVVLPVADMNLTTYLCSAPEACPDRANCLRTFYGCLAAGVEYLHGQRIRHKDIKPENVLVLVKDRRVLLADFGTSHNWEDDAGASSSGTVREAYTERYCAPEVTGKTRRNESSDIYSLGCIFFEMSTVLANLTIRDMRQFFEATGNGRPFIRDNAAATASWCERISQAVAYHSDAHVLELAKRMCDILPIERPTASQVAAEIVDFDGPVRYHCGCCVAQGDKSASSEHNIVQDLHSITRTEEWPAPVFQSMPQAHVLPKDPIPSPHKIESYKAPRVQEVPDELTVLHYDAQGGAVCTPRAAEDFDSRVAPGGGTMSISDSWSDTATLIPDECKTEKTSCLWPGCEVAWPVGASDPFLGRLLRQHYRVVHSCHEFGMHMWLSCPDYCPKDEDDEQPAVRAMELGQLECRSHPPSATQYLDPSVERVYQTRLARRQSRILEKSQNARARAEPRSVEPTANQGRRRGNSRRFSYIPEDRRPEPVTIVRDNEDVDVDLELDDVIEQPHLQAYWPHLCRTRDRSDISDYHVDVLPTASFVPSFHLATSNTFSTKELQSFIDAGVEPLFVYGTLMLPPILRACANFYTSKDGVYSESLQRRLRTSSSDWIGVDRSTQLAAEQMTPAVVRAKAGNMCHGLPCAQASISPGRDTIHGFLICGLSTEAFNCLDHWFEEELPSRFIKGFNKKSTTPKSRFFTRQKVSATVCGSGGELTSLNAVTYISVPSLGEQFYRRSIPWDLNEFLKGPKFNRLCQEGWTKEEKRLAFTMKIKFLERGDLFARDVIRDDYARVQQYLRAGYDVNASCRSYSTALQAASAKGLYDIAELLIEEGADINITGGVYKTPLIAATIQGHQDLAKLLLKNKANVLKDGGRHVNALYQAVSLQNMSLAHLLLEKGAWLHKNYREILDVAEENGNRDIVCLLEDYDVRGLSKRNKSIEQSSRRSQRSQRLSVSGRDVAYIPYEQRRALDREKSSSLFRAVAMQYLDLKGDHGKWTGIKAVMMLKTAIAHGASEDIIDKAGPFLGTFESLLNFLNSAAKGYAEAAENDKSPLEGSNSNGMGLLGPLFKLGTNKRGPSSQVRVTEKAALPVSRDRRRSSAYDDRRRSRTEDRDGRISPTLLRSNCQCNGSGSQYTSSGSRVRWECSDCSRVDRQRTMGAQTTPVRETREVAREDPPPPYSAR